MITNSLLLIITMATMLSLVTITESQSIAYAESDNDEICSGVGGEWKDGKCRADIDSNDKDEILEIQM